MRENFANDIEEAAAGEKIEAIVIGKIGWAVDEDEDRRGISKELRNRVLAWEVARPLLDYEYDGGFGGSDCHAIYAWTATHVLSVHEYDGSTRVIAVPRNPVDIKAEQC